MQSGVTYCGRVRLIFSMFNKLTEMIEFINNIFLSKIDLTDNQRNLCVGDICDDAIH